MSMIQSVRSIRESLRELALQPAPDEVALATFLQELEACARGVRASIDRAVDFANRGLVSEALSVIEDHPSLVREAEALRTIASDDAAIARFWATTVADDASRLPLPTAAEVEALAATVPDAGGVYLVPAFTGLGSPHWDPYARGAIVGLTRGTTKAHIARAALEAIAFQSAELLEAMQRDARTPLVELRVDGGATANDLLMQFQADLLGVPVVRPAVTETTALGAAYLAGLGVGYWRSIDELAGNWRVDRRFEPRLAREAVAARMEDWTRAVGRAKDWAR